MLGDDPANWFLCLCLLSGLGATSQWLLSGGWMDPQTGGLTGGDDFRECIYPGDPLAPSDQETLYRLAWWVSSHQEIMVDHGGSLGLLVRRSLPRSPYKWHAMSSCFFTDGWQAADKLCGGSTWHGEEDSSTHTLPGCGIST